MIGRGDTGIHDRGGCGNHPSAGKKKYANESPRVISDNGPQFIARDFKEYIRINEMSHVRTSPYYPQSNGKIERWHQSMKRECIRAFCPLSLEDARRLVEGFLEHSNTNRLHSANGYIRPKDKMGGMGPSWIFWINLLAAEEIDSFFGEKTRSSR
jgi:transposase InsO family protein